MRPKAQGTNKRSRRTVLQNDPKKYKKYFFSTLTQGKYMS